MRLHEIPTPALILDRGILARNLAKMQARVRSLGVKFRPHIKTAKSADVARLAVAGEFGGVTVSTLAEAEYLADHGFRDILVAVGTTPEKVDRAARLVERGVTMTVITDDLEVARIIGQHPAPIQALVEVDCGEHRGGVRPESAELLAISEALGEKLVGVMSHAGHSYDQKSLPPIQQIAEHERSAVATAAERLKQAGLKAEVVSVGSTPTATHAQHLHGVTEVRAGVYMFQDLFQAEIGSCTREDIALTVLASVQGRRPAENRLLVDGGALALSKDQSTRNSPRNAGFGLILDIQGKPSYGECVIERANQEHGVATSDRPIPFDALPIGTRVRVAPNHACLTAAAYDKYYVVDGGDEIVAVWDRINGW
ncbi:MAG TPA: alanine racemase [Gemmatimonadales bacterium]|nr:alanine racemase [Gemmatimonadales bacterium]